MSGEGVSVSSGGGVLGEESASLCDGVVKTKRVSGYYWDSMFKPLSSRVCPSAVCDVSSASLSYLSDLNLFDKQVFLYDVETRVIGEGLIETVSCPMRSSMRFVKARTVLIPLDVDDVMSMGGPKC